MSLVTYEDARPWAKAIRDQVSERSMPPWGAVKGVGAFRNDPSLTEVEIQMLIAWVEGGAPQGDDGAIAPEFKPPAAETKSPRPAKTLLIEADLKLDRSIVIRGILPESLDRGQAMQVDAWLPDGRIEHLIWLRNYRSEWTRDYQFRAPIRLPAGTTIHIASVPGAKARLLLGV